MHFFLRSGHPPGGSCSPKKKFFIKIGRSWRWQISTLRCYHLPREMPPSLVERSAISWRVPSPSSEKKNFSSKFGDPGDGRSPTRDLVVDFILYVLCDVHSNYYNASLTSPAASLANPISWMCDTSLFIKFRKKVQIAQKLFVSI